MSLFLFVSPREIILLLFVSIPLVVLFQVQCPHLKKRFQAFFIFGQKCLWGIFHLSRVVYCAFFHHKAVSVAGDGQTFSERLIHVHICGYCKKKDKNPRQGHWGKDSTSPVIQPFYFFTKNLVCLKGVDTFFSSALSYKVIVQIAMDLSE